MNFKASLTITALSFALALGGAGCSSETADSEISEAELIANLSVDAIRSKAAFESLSIEGGGFGQAGRLLKFFVDARDRANKKAYFINGNFKDAQGRTPDYA